MTNPCYRKPAPGFTLLEVISGLGIVILILGGVFSIAAGSMDLSRSSNDSRITEIRYTQLGQVLRSNFRQLPAQREIEILPDGFLHITGGGNSFRWPGLPTHSDTVVIRLREKNIEIAHFLDDVEVAALLLMENVSTMQWQIFDPEIQDWVNEWSEQPADLVSLIKLSYSGPDKETFEEIFRTPVFVPADFTPPTTENNETAE